MSDFKLNCPHCNQHLEAPDELLGTTVECPSCQGAIAVARPETMDILPLVTSEATTMPEEEELEQETVLEPGDSGIFCYSPSGKYGLATIPFAIAGLLVAFLLAWLYNGFLSINPLVYFNFFATIIFAGCIGGATGLALQRGKCRNLTLATIIGLVIGILSFFIRIKLAYPSSYALRAYLNKGWGLGFLFSKHAVIHFKGDGIYFVWFLEVIIIIVACIWATRRYTGDPFCEDCNCWAESTEIGTFQRVNDKALKQAIDSKNAERVIDVLLLSNGTKTASLETYSCTKCQAKHYVNITLKWKEKNEKKDEEILRNMSLTTQQLAVLKSRAFKKA